MVLAFALFAAAAYSINIDIDTTKVLHDMNPLYMGYVSACRLNVDVSHQVMKVCYQLVVHSNIQLS